MQPETATVSELERALADKHRSLDRFLRKRSRLMKELEATEAEIKKIGGASARHLKPRPRNAKSLHTVVTTLLGKRQSGYDLEGLASAVLKTGYKTSSTDFKNVLYQCLYNSEVCGYDDKKCKYVLLPAPVKKKK